MLRDLGHPGRAVLDAEERTAVTEGNHPGHAPYRGSGPHNPEIHVDDEFEPWSNL